MQINNIFTSFVAIDYLDIDNQEMIDYALDLKSKNKSVTQSNRVGWQSGHLDLSLSVFQPLFSKINTVAQDLHNEIGLKKDLNNKLTTAWMSVNNKSGYNVQHRHLNACFSGTYYLKGIESGANGNIVFKNPWAVDYHVPDKCIEEFTNVTSGAHSISPEAGKLLIFPSWLEHYVETNTTDIDRISLSFDTRVHVYV